MRQFSHFIISCGGFCRTAYIMADKGKERVECKWKNKQKDTIWHDLNGKLEEIKL
jgi:hypothetical protein